jgi:hypothetical protein
VDDFADAVKFIDAARRFDEASDEFHGLFLAAITRYARPFSRNELSKTAAADPRLKVTGLRALLGPDGVALHKRIIKFRNKVVAHAESEFNPMQVMQPTVPDRPGMYTDMLTVSRRWHPAQEGIDLGEFRSVAEKMQVNTMNQLADLAHAIRAT